MFIPGQLSLRGEVLVQTLRNNNETTDSLRSSPGQRPSPAPAPPPPPSPSIPSDPKDDATHQHDRRHRPHGDQVENTCKPRRCHRQQPTRRRSSFPTPSPSPPPPERTRQHCLPFSNHHQYIRASGPITPSGSPSLSTPCPPPSPPGRRHLPRQPQPHHPGRYPRRGPHSQRHPITTMVTGSITVPLS